MARSKITDPLQNNHFWLLDVAPIQPLGLPLFTPALGFQAITMPELTLDAEDIDEGNGPYKRKVLTGSASTNTITLQRAVTLGDGDFHRWVQAALHGNRELLTGGPLGALAVGGSTYRRTFMILHYFARSPSRGSGLAGLDSILGAITAGAGALGAANAATSLGGLTLATAAGIGPFETFAKLPARAILLQGCIPTRFKPGGDLDATSAEVSMQELDIAYESFDLIDLGG